MDTARYAQLFQSEGRELVSRLNDSLLAMERDEDPLAHVHAVFRAMHTMKGMAAAMGYVSIAAAAHEAEEVIAAVRDDGHAPSPSLVDALFATVDWLDAALGKVADEGAEPDASGIVALLQFASPREVQPGVRRVHVRQSSDAPLSAVRALMILQRVRDAGTVTEVSPAEESLRAAPEALELEFTFEGTTPNDELERLVRSAGEVDSCVIFVGGEPYDAPHHAQPGEVPHAQLHARSHAQSQVQLHAQSHAQPHAQSRASGAGAVAPRELRARDGAVAPAGRNDDEADTDALPERVAPASRATSVVRVELRRLDSLMAITGELVIARARIRERALASADPALQDAAAQLGRLVGELQGEVLATRMVPAALVFDRYPRFVRDAARKLGKDVRFAMIGRDIELDRALLEELGEPLVHLLRNALDHGFEPADVRVAAGKPASGTLTVAVTRERDGVVIRVSDDGQGVDREAALRQAQAAGIVPHEVVELADDDLLRVLGTAGLSTTDQVTELSGRGVGVDAVLTTVRRLGGTVDLRTVAGKGTTWSMRLPATLAIVRALLARVGKEIYALPATHVRATADLAGIERGTVRGRDVVVLGEDVLPVVRLREVVGLVAPPPLQQDLVVLAAEDRRIGLLVDELVAQEEIVVKPFDAAREGERLFSGATVLSDGAPALIVDVGSLL